MMRRIAVHLYYRHVNQGERWLSAEMERSHDGYSAAIAGDYTNSVYPLQYYFVLQRGTDSAWFFPAFNASLSNQPYYAIAKRSLECERSGDFWGKERKNVPQGLKASPGLVLCGTAEAVPFVRNPFRSLRSP